MCFVWILEETAIISQYLTGFVTEMGFVYNAVRTESLYTIQVRVRF